MKYHISSLLIASTLSFAYANSVAAGETEMIEFEAGRGTYQLDKVFWGEIYLQDEDDQQEILGSINSIFFHEGYVYVYSPVKSGLFAFPLPSENVESVIASPVELEFPEEGHHAWRYYYFGQNEIGECYAASFIHSKPGVQSQPFEISLIDFDSWDKLIVKRSWTLPVGTSCEWGPRYPKVYGYLSSDNFTVAAQIWEHSTYKKLDAADFTTLIAQWKVLDSEITGPNWGRDVISGASVSPLKDNLFLVHDKQMWNSAPSLNYARMAVPTIVRFSGTNKVQVHSTLNSQCTQIDDHGCGALIFGMNDDYFMAYHTGIGKDDMDAEEPGNKLALSYLSNDFKSIDQAKEIATMMPAENTSSVKDDEIAHIVVHNPLNEDAYIFAKMPNDDRMGIYNLKTTAYNAPTTSIIMPEIENNQIPVYYTPQGIKLSEEPSASGIYIRIINGSAEKVIIGKK